VVGSYGNGAATIAPPTGDGISVYDTGGVDIQNLDLVGAPGPNVGAGIHVYSDLPAGKRLDHIDVSHVDATKFIFGISVSGENPGAGFSDVTVSDSDVHDNIDAGLLTYGPAFNPKSPTYANQHVIVSHVVAAENFGNSRDKTNNTGNGIVLGSVITGVISSSVAARNGGSGAAGQGPAGIWTYDSTDVDIEHNLAYSNRTRNRSDGNGFGLDQNVSHSVMQDNLSYGNDGTGFLVYSSLNNGAQRYNTVRDNISSDDVRDGSVFYGSLSVIGFIADCTSYQNTLVVKPSGPSTPPALRISPDLKSITFVNNIFATESGPIVATAAALPLSSVRFEDNDYYSATGFWQISWGDSSYDSLAQWQAGTGQESTDGKPAGFSLNPKLTGPIGDLTASEPGDPAAARGFKLQSGSPMIAAGHTLVGVGPAAPTNYLGQPQSPKHPDLGAI
jgi:hypothetical protein